MQTVRSFVLFSSYPCQNNLNQTHATKILVHILANAYLRSQIIRDTLGGGVNDVSHVLFIHFFESASIGIKGYFLSFPFCNSKQIKLENQWFKKECEGGSRVEKVPKKCHVLFELTLKAWHLSGIIYLSRISIGLESTKFVNQRTTDPKSSKIIVWNKQGLNNIILSCELNSVKTFLL